MGLLKQTPSYTQRCRACKEAIISSKIYCELLGEYVDDLVYCPSFKPKSVVKTQTRM